MSKKSIKYYRIVRFYQNAKIRKRVIKSTNSLTVAQEHCNDPESSWRTCTNAVGKARTRKVGPWFDGYETVYRKKLRGH